MNTTPNSFPLLIDFALTHDAINKVINIILLFLIMPHSIINEMKKTEMSTKNHCKLKDAEFHKKKPVE